MTQIEQGSVMVVGAGIAGIQASLDLAESGHRVFLVDKNNAIGGTMAQLDKTFPTNDCSMCIISPKLVEAGRHLNIELITQAEVLSLEGEAGDFTVAVQEEARFIDLEKCTACGECAKVCPVDLPNGFDENLGERKAAYKLYPQAMPSAYAIEKTDPAPCRGTCPAGLNVQGYVQMVKQGKYEQALEIIMDQLPLPAVLGRVCPHECEDVCRRCQLDGPVAIRDLKRLAADQFDPRQVKIHSAPDTGKRVAVVGSGPAGLSAAYHLARMGVKVQIFEALSQPGGMLRVGIPDHRLPPHILDRDIEVITQLGVEIHCNRALGRDFSLDDLFAKGFDAVFLGLGAHKGLTLGIPGETLHGVCQGVDFLREYNLDQTTPLGDIREKNMAIIGGGNVAIDVARTAVRLGAARVTLLYRRTREEMPAWEEEIQAAEDEGVEIQYLTAPVAVLENQGRVGGVTLMKMELGPPDDSGRRRPLPVEDSEFQMPLDILIPAIGQQPDLPARESFSGVKISKWQTAETRGTSPATDRAGVFAGGDFQTGPGIAIGAVAAGMEAARAMGDYLGLESHVTALDREGDTAGQQGDAKEPVFRDIPHDLPHQPRRPMPELAPASRAGNFSEVELGYDPDEGRAEAARCLNCGHCSECMQCVEACLARAVDHTMTGNVRKIHVGAVILAPGFTPYDPSSLVPYCYGHSPNVLTSLEFERLLSASGPYAGHLVRPSDREEPRKIAWIQCVGSRDINAGDHAYCSGVCCMYANKQAVIAKEHNGADLDTAIFFMDMRTHGKDFDAYHIRARDESGVRFVRSRIHSVFPEPGDRYRLVYSSEAGKSVEEVFDMVVLSIGLAPNPQAGELARRLGIELNGHGFAQTRDLDPVATTRDGVYVCGTFQEPKDIPASVMEASAAAQSASVLMKDHRWQLTQTPSLPPEMDIQGTAPRIGVFVCNCGINIGGVANVPEVREYAATLPGVVHVEDNLFTCSQDAQDHMKEVILEHGINRVVVASCSPRTHEALFRETIRDVGLNPYLFEMANIRDQNTWVHMDQPEAATEKAKDLVRMAVAKATFSQPLHRVEQPVAKSLLVVGGGVAGLTTALGAARQGVGVHLVEKSDVLGGIARSLNTSWKGEWIQDYLDDLVDQVRELENIEIHLESQVSSCTGTMGNFTTHIQDGHGVETSIHHGAAVIATGGGEYQPREYLHGEHPGVLTHLEMDRAFREREPRVRQAHTIAFIQCVGSRDNDHPYCSRVCCTHSLKSAIAFKALDPRKRVYILYRDIRAYGFREDLYKRARELGVIFIRYDLEEMPRVEKDGDGRLVLTVVDHVLRTPVTLSPDLLVLASGVVPGKNRDLHEIFKIPVNGDGFLVEAHAKLRPVDFASDGLFVAGLAHYPKPIEESIAQAGAAVSRAMTILSRDSLRVGGVVAEVTPEKCAVCLTCVRTCPYGIPRIQEEGYAAIDPAQCHGCGACVAECPGKAITLNHFTDQQIMAKTHALFHGDFSTMGPGGGQQPIDTTGGA